MLIPRPAGLGAPSFLMRVRPLRQRAEVRELGYSTVRRKLAANGRGASGWEGACRYSLSYAAGSRSSTVLYFLHGWMSDDRSWVDRSPNRLIRDRWRQRGLDIPVVASISFGRGWIFGVPALREHFLRELVPRIEAEVAARTGQAVEQRLLYGVSMGGINATYLALNQPDFARKVVAASPAYHELTPWSSLREIGHYSKDSRAFSPAVGVATGYARLTVAQLFEDPAHFEREANIFTLASRTLGPNTPPLLITSGQRDPFGFDRGAGKLMALADARGARAELVRMPTGGHAWVPARAVADFLLD